MKQAFVTLLFFSFFLFSNYQLLGQSPDPFVHQSLKKVWESEKLLATPESVIYDEKNDVLYVSNVNGKPSDKDGNGFITKMSTEGKILNLKWINGLNAPKGMAIFNGKLYVSDIDHLVEIDIKQGKIIKQHKAKKAKFLNDVAVDKEGAVFVSDMENNIIYQYKNDTFDIWLRIGNLFQPNGLLVDNNCLLIGCMNYVVSADLKTKHVRTFITETGSIDGIIKNDKDHYIISDWLGNINLIDKTNPKIKLLSTESNKINAADIEYISSKKLLLVPTFFDNRVMAYEINL
ncbi:MAG: hypothetical protein P1P88_15470 [Bacteroidales bacterium]|nr:hypothetical protein [Bacteroidales bacterium]